jgi:bleomycin hydrolase
MFLSFGMMLNAQIHPDFTITKKIQTTPVKSQGRTGTCWSFATISFLETEAIRMGKPSLDLSEMFIVRNAYKDKAIKYVRYHGKANFSEGGQAHDVINTIKKYGLVTDEDYSGLQYGSNFHNHGELFNSLDGILKGVAESPGNKPTTAWFSAFDSALESYLGKTPASFTYQGKNYDPLKFAREVAGINPDDYIELTSYKIYPYYKMADLEIPDNWSHNLYYNVTINDIMAIIDNALNNGYSVAWDGDVSEEDFNHSEGTAVLSMTESDGIIMNSIDNMRQSTFDNYTTTDDHLMHITGLAKDSNGAIFYLTKNSWGENSNKYGGYLYMSNWFVQLKTVAILVHKDAVPKDIKKKLGI